MIQDVADQLTDTATADWGRKLCWPIAGTLGSEGRHRLAVLFADRDFERTSPLWRNMRPQREHFREILKSTHPGEKGTEKFLADLKGFVAGGRRAEKKAERYVNVLFYEAKNWAYSQQTYFAELEGIQRRIDFARGIFLVALVGFALGVMATVLCAIAWCSNFRHAREGYEGVRCRLRRREIANVAAVALGMVALLVGVGLLASVAYANAQVFFNERAFGYYASHLQYRTLVARELPAAEAGP